MILLFICDRKTQPTPEKRLSLFEMKKIAFIFTVLLFWGCVPNRPFDQDHLTPVPIKQSYISLRCNSFAVSRVGSAVIIKNGYAITNRHVVEGAQGVMGYMAGGIKFPVTEIILNERFDLALFKIPTGIGKPIPIGERIEIGECVYSAGTTLKSTILDGIVRETEFMIHHQDIDISRPYDRDDAGRPMSLCLIYEGNFQKGFSGGPIVNEQGELVGINQGYIIEFLGIHKPWQDKSKRYGVGYHMTDILGEINRMLAQSNKDK
jgi:S1-C subfamily serine protease